MKFLIILLLFGVLVFFIIRAFMPKPKTNETEMVKCHTCGTYIAKSEAIVYNKYHYCSKKCLN